jgi:hypothetical protein
MSTRERVALRLSADTVVLDVYIDPGLRPPVDPETLVVQAASLICLRLTERASRHYEFALDQPAVVVHDGGESFGQAHRRSDSLVTLRDKHTLSGDFKYTVHLVERKTREPLAIDPVIRNEQ